MNITRKTMCAIMVIMIAGMVIGCIGVDKATNIEGCEQYGPRIDNQYNDFIGPLQEIPTATPTQSRRVAELEDLMYHEIAYTYTDGQNIRVGVNQDVNCGDGCNIDTGFGCIITCGDGCNIDCGDGCTVRCGDGCNIYHGERCDITHGAGCNTFLLYPD